MKIEEIKHPTVWNSFFNVNSSPSFLQSWEWGEFEKNNGYEILRLGIYSSSNVEKNSDKSSRQARTLKAMALVIKIKAKRGRFLFIPHGPIIEVKNQKSKVKNILKTLLIKIQELAVKGNFTFIRIAPIFENTPENQKIFSDLGFKKAPIYMHAERLWILPLTVETRHASSLQYINDEQLLSGMRKTTRYLIRKAERDGVIIEKRTDEKAIADFWKIYEETAKRENFVPFSKDFIRKEFEAFNKTGNALFLFGKIDSGVVPADSTGPPQNDVILASEEPALPAGRRARPESNHLASALIIFTKSTAFYHQGASIHSKIPVTYLLQWEAIKEAKRRGCLFYNFWGILQEGRTPKNWQGLTLFKTGFGGKQIDYLPTQDYIISPKYYLTYLYEKFLGWRRGV